MIIIRNKRSALTTLLKEYPDAVLIDVTSKAGGEWKQLSPFFPHGDIPVPYSDGMTSMSVEGVWQGLKVFDGEDIDLSCFGNATMKGLKRTERTHGRTLGHRKGVGGRLLKYIEARKLIYLPVYYWMLEHKCAALVQQISELSENRTVILLDYNTTCDIDNPDTPLSHASLIRRYIEERR